MPALQFCVLMSLILTNDFKITICPSQYKLIVWESQVVPITPDEFAEKAYST